MLTWLDSVPITMAVLLALTLGLAPFTPEPHLFEKVRMLVQGTLVKPVDIFDLLFHLAPWLLLAAKLTRMVVVR